MRTDRSKQQSAGAKQETSSLAASDQSTFPLTSLEHHESTRAYLEAGEQLSADCRSCLDDSRKHVRDWIVAIAGQQFPPDDARNVVDTIRNIVFATGCELTMNDHRVGLSVNTVSLNPHGQFIVRTRAGEESQVLHDRITFPSLAINSVSLDWTHVTVPSELCQLSAFDTRSARSFAKQGASIRKGAQRSLRRAKLPSQIDQWLSSIDQHRFPAELSGTVLSMTKHVVMAAGRLLAYQGQQIRLTAVASTGAKNATFRVTSPQQGRIYSKTRFPSLATLELS